jgi:hypothetical protein
MSNLNISTMKKRLLSVLAGTLIGGLAFTQVNVPLLNPSFELPAGGKISTFDNDTIPGWFSDTSYVNSGREQNATATDGIMECFTSNLDGTVAHVVEPIADVPNAVTYVLTFDGSLVWNPGTVAVIYTKFSVFSGTDRSSRVTLDSMAFPIDYVWMTYNHAFEFEANSAYAGDSLVFEWNVYGDVENTWAMVDNFKMTKYTESEVTSVPITNVLDGTNLSGASDWSGLLKGTWDADSIYMQFIITDDSIFTTGNAYAVDNVEIYFDMDNSKNIHWPRNGAWVAAVDAAFDTNDYQLRLVPGVDFSVNNSSRPTGPGITDGYRQVYAVTDTGYNFNLNIAWNALLDGFVPEVGKVIGFDLDASDNDNDPDYRDQITLNSPTLQLFNDPSLWASVQIGPYGQFIGLPSDMTPPTVPAGLDTVKVDSNKVNLGWTPSTDQATAVMQYIVYQDDVEIASVYGAAPTSQTYMVTGLMPETTYSFSIVAVDNYGNESAMSSAKAVTTDPLLPPEGISDNKSNLYKIYPNPSSGILNIETNSLAPVTVEIYNIAGKLVSTDQFTNRYRVDVSTYGQGMYMIYLKSADQTTVEKFIIE